MLRTIFKCLLVAGVIAALIGSASSFAINSGDSRGEASIGTGAVSVEGCSADVQVDINGGDNRDAAAFSAAAGGFIVRSIDVDASQGDSDCATRTGKVWLQLMDDDDPYGPILGPTTLTRGKASFDNLDHKKLLPGKITHVHVMIELGS